MSKASIGRESVEVANAIGRACEGRSTAAVLIGISMVLGSTAALAKYPNLDELMSLVKKQALEEFHRAREGGEK